MDRLTVFRKRIEATSVIAKKSTRHRRNGNLTEIQTRYLEEIQVLARKGGLPESEWKSITKYDRQVCYELDCLESALEIMAATNFTVDPCESSTWAGIRNDSNGFLFALAILEDRSGLHENDFLWNEAKNHYYQCKHKARADDQDVKDIMSYTEQYGNWPILTNRDPGEVFNWLEMVADLNRFERPGFSPYLLKVVVPEFMKELGPIEFNIGRAVVHVSTNDLQKMLTLVQQKIGRNKPVRIDQIPAMVTFMASVSGSTVVQEKATLMSIAEFQNKTDTYMSDQNITMNVNWLNFFTRVFRGSESIKVSPELKINVSFSPIMNVISSVNTFQQSNDKKDTWAIANILHFQLVSLLLQESTVLLDDMNSFRCVELSGDRSEICLARVKDVFGYALGATYVKTYYDDRKTTPAIKILMNDIKESYIDVIDKTKWMKNTTREFLKDKIRSIKTVIGYPKWIKKPKQLQEFFHGLELSPLKNSSYPKNYIAVNTWRVAKRRSWSHKYSNITAWKGFPLYDVEWNHYSATVQAQYHKAINEARIEAGVLQAPIFGINRPGINAICFVRFMNFGGLGMVIAHEVGHSFDIIGRMFNKDGESDKEYWDEESLTKYFEWVKEIAEQYGTEPYGVSETSAETVDPWKTINEDIADILAVYISYHSYQTYLKNLEAKGEKEKILPGLQRFSPQKLFYMKYANMWCDNKDVQSKFRDLLSDHSSGNTRATLPLKYSKQFARAFECKLLTS
ncbi:Endothelin-converting enzyme 1 [Orchesella cincta]|uniref:Endothelin-converting enzyme 1 n=1 Tax=Orchesella cincta TaxID=48709 RepID=A0A1D2N4R5_ORCCI|nr:Endothelin-converting enzyme 1 [Orchesella cincta]